MKILPSTIFQETLWPQINYEMHQAFFDTSGLGCVKNHIESDIGTEFGCQRISYLFYGWVFKRSRFC